MSEENIENITKSDSNLPSTFFYYHLLSDINFNAHCLINNIDIPKKIINLYISYTLTSCLRKLNTDFTLKNCLFGPVKLTKNADRVKYKHSGYDREFACRSEFLFTDGNFGKNVILFGADMSSSANIDNTGKYILVLGEGNTRIR